MIDRRKLLQVAAGITAASGIGITEAAVANPAAGRPATGPDPDTAVTTDLVAFARGLRYESLPASVVHAAKRYILDSLGCTVAGHLTDKGRLAVASMLELGGAPQARILGTGQRTCATHAAFANGELTNGLDYDAIPHIPPFILAPILAVAERKRASGKALIVAVVVAHEIAARLSLAAGQGGPGVSAHAHPTLGINDESIMAAAAGLANLLALDEASTRSAVGLAANFCPPRSSDDWEQQSPLSMVKYTPAGWICHGSVLATTMAAHGYTGIPNVLDGPRSFPYYYGWENWKPEVATAGLGQSWKIETVDFKPYACCRFIHSQVDCLARLMDRHALKHDQIQRITSLGVPLPANPDKMNVRTQVDAQFSIPYVLALVARGVPLDAHCQSPERLRDPEIRLMMTKISWGDHPDADRARHEHRGSFVARVEVQANGQTFVEESLYASGTASAGLALSDEFLRRKFLNNAGTLLSAAKAHAALQTLWHLEDLQDTAALVDELTV